MVRTQEEEMKHASKVTALLLLFFFLAQLLGLGLLAIEAQATGATVEYAPTAIGERPQFESSYGPTVYLLVGVGIGTILLLWIMRMRNARAIWKWWYFLAILLAVTAALGVVLPTVMALVFAGFLAYQKTHHYNIFVHNITELFMYAGLAVLFVPVFTVAWAAVLLIIISVYDMYAVWKSQHMVRLATFTKKNQLFAGILVNYETKGKKTTLLQSNPDALKQKPKKINSALLGGGDVLFPLLFTGAVFTQLLTEVGSKAVALLGSFVIVGTTALALYLLFSLGKKHKFYPAMPFVSIGCFVGYVLVQLLI